MCVLILIALGDTSSYQIVPALYDCKYPLKLWMGIILVSNLFFYILFIPCFISILRLEIYLFNIFPKESLRKDIL